MSVHMLSTHSLIGHTDDPGVAADHQENEAEKRHVPSAKTGKKTSHQQAKDVGSSTKNI